VLLGRAVSSRFVPPHGPPPKKSGAGVAFALLAVLLLLLVLVGAGLGAFVVWRRLGPAAAKGTPAASASSAAASASPGAASGATKGVEPLVFDRNPFAE